MTETRVCVNPDCEHHGAEQSINNFRKRYYNNKDHYSRQCKDCEYKKNRDRWFLRAYTKTPQAPNDDPEDDLVPMESGGFVRWAVLTEERRNALGEKSPYNGLSVSRNGSAE